MTPDAALHAEILVCDSGAGARRAAALLSGQGYDVRRARTGPEAVRLLGACPADVVVLDLDLPGGARRVLRAASACDPRPALLVAGTRVSLDGAGAALRDMADDYLRKPYTPAEAVARVALLLHGRRLARRCHALQEQLAAYETERQTAARALCYQDSHDGVTRLPNRARLGDRLELALGRAHASGGGIVVFHLGLDRFRLVNDALGQAVGDALLHAYGARLQRLLGPDDTLARPGGDEFVVVRPHAPGAAPAEALARRMLAESERPFRIDGHELYVTASIGAARFPAHAGDGDGLVRKARIAMAAAKAAGRRAFRLYAPAMDAQHARRLVLATDLRHALERGEFRMQYQPQFDVERNAITGAEALLRWRHPRLGLLAPPEFLGIAEEAGLLPRLGLWTVRTVCEEAARWPCDVRVAVNLSAVQLQQDDLASCVVQTLHRTGLMPSRLEIEVTEDGLMGDLEAVAARLTALARYGVRIAVDDFGTGYSSLSYLHRLPIHTLKIDRSFVQDLREGRQAIVSAIVSMAGNLRLGTVAEGVETEAQAEGLRRIGCRTMQGFLFSRPVEADALRGLLCPPGAGPANIAVS